MPHGVCKGDRGSEGGRKGQAQIKRGRPPVWTPHKACLRVWILVSETVGTQATSERKVWLGGGFRTQGSFWGLEMFDSPFQWDTFPRQEWGPREADFPQGGGQRRTRPLSILHQPWGPAQLRGAQAPWWALFSSIPSAARLLDLQWFSNPGFGVDSLSVT